MRTRSPSLKRLVMSIKQPKSSPSLTLVVEANRWAGSFTLLSLTWASGETIEDYDLQDAQLQIPLHATARLPVISWN